MKKTNKLLLPVFAIIVVILDRISKYLVVEHLKDIKSIPVIENVLNFTYVENRGMAFGALQNARWVFMIVTSLIIVAIVVLFIKHGGKSKLFDVSLGLILGGGIGNMIDRVFLGYVIDFIDFCAFDFWTWVFNVADSAVTVGSIIFAVYLVFYDKILFSEGDDSNG